MIKDSPALGELTKLGEKHTGKFSHRWPGNGGPQSGHPMQFGGQVHITVKKCFLEEKVLPEISLNE